MWARSWVITVAKNICHVVKTIAAIVSPNPRESLELPYGILGIELAIIFLWSGVEKLTKSQGI